MLPSEKEELRKLMERWPKGCQPPTGYLAWHDWADAQDAHGLSQSQCKGCGLWHFPQEAAKHIGCTVPSASGGHSE